MTASELQAFFEDRMTREEDIKGLRDEMKEALDSFCSSMNSDKKAVSMAYRLFKHLQKDRQDAEAVQYEFDCLAELIIKTGKGE